MANLVARMVRDALDAFVRRDAAEATRVTQADDEVDALYRQIFRELLSFHLLLIARNMERIADHATNIAEDVIYYFEGKDVRPLGQRQAEAGR